MIAETYYVDLKKKVFIDKDPGSRLDYPFNWSKWLNPLNDTIQSATFTVNGGCTVDLVEFDALMATAWVRDGTPLAQAALTCRIVTVGGRIEEHTVYLNITQK